MRIAFNVASLYAAWFASVLAAANGRPILATAASLVVVLLNVAISRDRLADMRLIAYAALVGFVLDSIVINLGLARYASPGPYALVPPLWLVAMWMAFATSLNVSLAWFKSRLRLATLLGAIGGPLSYYAGARLGGMEFAEPLSLSIGALGLLWAIAFPTLVIVARQGESGPTNE